MSFNKSYLVNASIEAFVIRNIYSVFSSNYFKNYLNLIYYIYIILDETRL